MEAVEQALPNLPDCPRTTVGIAYRFVSGKKSITPFAPSDDILKFVPRTQQLRELVSGFMSQSRDQVFHDNCPAIHCLRSK